MRIEELGKAQMCYLSLPWNSFADEDVVDIDLFQREVIVLVVCGYKDLVIRDVLSLGVFPGSGEGADPGQVDATASPDLYVASANDFSFLRFVCKG